MRVRVEAVVDVIRRSAGFYFISYELCDVKCMSLETRLFRLVFRLVEVMLGRDGGIRNFL